MRNASVYSLAAMALATSGMDFVSTGRVAERGVVPQTDEQSQRAISAAQEKRKRKAAKRTPSQQKDE